MQVAKWGNSLAVHLPKVVVQALKLREGDDIEINIEGERRMTVSRTADQDELIARLHALRGRLPRDFKFDREEANAR